MIAADRDLARRLRRGDKRAFETFFDTHFPALYRFSRARLGDDDLAEEAVQAALSTALDRIHTWRGEASLMTWLHTIVRREILRLAERRRRDREILVLFEDAPDIEAAIASLESGERGDPERLLDRRELARRVQATLDRLPDRYGDALEWKYIQGRTVAEIAERLGVGPKAAESLLTRARAAFRDAFGSLEGPDLGGAGWTAGRVER